MRCGEDRPACRAVLVQHRREPVRALGIEAVERLVEQPQRRARRGDARKRRPLGLARRQQAHGHVGKAGEAEQAHRRIEPIVGPAEPRPEHKRTPQGQLAVEGERFVGKREGRAVDPALLRPENPGREADQARLAAAIGPGDLKRLARPKVQIEALEQQTAAAFERDVAELQQRLHSTLSSSACMSSSEKPKWWPTSWITMWATIRSRLKGVERHSSRIGRLYKRDSLGQHARLVDALVG